MKLTINAQEYAVPKEYQKKILAHLLAIGQVEYEKLDKKWRIMAKPVTRAILKMLEDHTTAHYGKAHGLAFRPERHDDPNLFLMHILSLILGKGLDYIEVAIDVENTSYTATAFNVSIEGQSLAGGQVGFTRDERLWQNDGIKIS